MCLDVGDGLDWDADIQASWYRGGVREVEEEEKKKEEKWKGRKRKEEEERGTRRRRRGR